MIKEKKERALPGQSALELVFVLPIMILLLFALVDGATLFRTELQLNAAAAEAVRWAASEKVTDASRVAAHARKQAERSGWANVDAKATASGDTVRYRASIPENNREVMAKTEGTALAVRVTATPDTFFGRVLGARTVTVAGEASGYVTREGLL